MKKKERLFRWCWIFAGALGIGAAVAISGQKEETKKDAAVEAVSDSPPKAPEDSEPKKIALTFDDGPHPVYTEQMLELLEKEQVPATFFLFFQS